MPAIILQIRILGLQQDAQLIDLIFQDITIHHGKIMMMIMLVMGDFRMIVNQLIRMGAILMMNSCVQEYTQTAALQSRYGDDRYAEHFRQTVQIDFHTAFFYNIHHIQGDDDRTAQFQ